MKKIRHIAKGGDTLEKVAQEMVDLAKKHNCSVRCDFDDPNHLLRAEPYYKVETIIKKKKLEDKRALKAWINSDEHKRRESEQAERIIQGREKTNILMSKVHQLNFTNKLELINWLCELENSSQYEEIDSETVVKILETFSIHHYFPYVPDKSDGFHDDEDNRANWIINGALEALKEKKLIMPHIHGYANKWKKRFLEIAA